MAAQVMENYSFRFWLNFPSLSWSVFSEIIPWLWLDLGGGRSHASWKLLLSFFVRRRLQILDGNLHVQLQEDFYNSSTPHCFSVKYLTTKQTSKLPVRLFHCLNVENKGLMMTWSHDDRMKMTRWQDDRSSADDWMYGIFLFLFQSHKTFTCNL